MDTIKKIIHPNQHGHNQANDTVAATESGRRDPMQPYANEAATNYGAERATAGSGPMGSEFAGANNTYDNNAVGTGAATSHHMPGHIQQQHHLGRENEMQPQHNNHHLGRDAVAVEAAREEGKHHGNRHHNHAGRTGGVGAAPGGAMTGMGAGGAAGGGMAGGGALAEAEMNLQAAEAGNNFPGTNPHPAHSALGTQGPGAGTVFPGTQ